MGLPHTDRDESPCFSRIDSSEATRDPRRGEIAVASVAFRNLTRDEMVRLVAYSSRCAMVRSAPESTFFNPAATLKNVPSGLRVGALPPVIALP